MYWLSRLFRKEKTEKQLDSELRFHLEQQIADHIRDGMSPDEARRRAQIEFGGMEGVKEECRESRRVHIVDTLLQDTRYGLRMMRKSPGFTTVAVLTLALGIGANTAIFSIVNGVLLNPLPYPHPEQLVALGESKPNFQNGSISYPNFRDWQKENRTFSAMAMFRTTAFSLTGLGDAEQIRGQFTSSDLFPLLGIEPGLGRSFLPGEDEIGAAPIAMISAALWQRKFGGARDVLGKTITLDGKAYSIVGVTPPNFDLVVVGFRTSDVYIPIGQWNNPLLRNRGAGLGIHGLGRLKPGIDLQQARMDMDRVSRGLAETYPDADKGIGANLTPLQKQITGAVQPFLLVLFAAVGFVLLIACVNVANLLLARSNSRAREFAVRLALGAGKGRVVRQLLTESVLLGIAGGGLGLALAIWSTRVIAKTLPEYLPRTSEIGLDARVLLFTMLVSLVSGVLFGLIPAFKTSRTNVLAPIKESGRSVSNTRHRAQNTFVVAELAMALVLLAGAGLMIRSLVGLWRVNPGFESHNVLNFGVSLPPAMLNASPAAIRSAFRELDNKLASIPGVQAVSQTWEALPLGGDDERLFWIDGEPKPATQNDMRWAINYVVGSDYLKVMRIPLLGGRFITHQDDENSPHVVVVDEVFARTYFPNQNPIGKRIHMDPGDQVIEIVGVVGHVRQWGLAGDDRQSLRAQFYFACMQMPDGYVVRAPSGAGVVLRSAGTQSGLFSAIRNASSQMSREQVIFGTQTMDELISDSLAQERLSMILLGAFAALALLLASLGIYGVISYIVGQRTQEIGIRMALGARRIHVVGMVLGQGTRLVLIGIAAGLVAGLALTRLMSKLLFGVSPADPLTFTCVAVLLMLVGLLACAIPARRATRVDPMLALRYE